MSKVPEEVKKQLLDYPFVTAVRSSQVGQMWQETAKSSEKPLNTGVGA